MKTTSDKVPPKPNKTRMNLDIPQDIDRYKARKIQIAIRHLDKLLATNPTQFNTKAYIELLDQFGTIAEKIKRNKKNDKTRMAENGDANTATEVGEGTSAGVDVGVPAENPFSR